MKERDLNRVFGLGSHLFRWVLGALLVGMLEAVFCLATFDVLPLSVVATGILAYVLFSLLAGLLSFLFVVSSRVDFSQNAHRSTSLFVGVLVFFLTIVLVRRTPYLLRLFGQGEVMLLIAVIAAAVTFLLSKKTGVRTGKPAPFFFASIVLVLLVFLLVRYFNHYSNDTTIFFEPPALYYNALLVLLFIPGFYIIYRLMSAGRIERFFTAFEEKRGLPVLLVLTLLLFAGGRLYSPDVGITDDRPNILLVVMDTTRSDFLSSYGHERPTSPNIDALAAEGALFENCVATAPWTVPTHCSMFSGLYTSSHGAHWEHMYLDDAIETAGEILTVHGYQTVGFSNNPVVGHSTNLSQGYEDFYEMWKSASMFPTIYSQIEDLLIAKTGRQDAGARVTNEMIRGWLERNYDREKPFFMFINYLEPHLVYNPPVQFRERFAKDDEVTRRMRRMDIHTLYRLLADDSTEGFTLTNEEIQALRDLYSAEIAYLDSKIGELTTYLESGGYLERTLLIITADHGENIGEHDLIDHQLNLYDTTLMIPLILRYPRRIEEGLRISGLVQSVDVFPTMLDVAGVRERELSDSVRGRSLFFDLMGEGSRVAAFSEYMSPRDQFKKVQKWAEAKGKATDFLRFDRRLKSMKSDSLKYIWSSDGEDEMYHILSDPGEEEDLAGVETEALKKMKTRLDEWVSSLPRLTEGTSEIPEMDRETHDLLKALGYVE